MSYFSSPYHPAGMLNSVINSGPSGNSSSRFRRPDYPTAEWPIPGKIYDYDEMSDEGLAELAKDRREYAEKERAKFKMDKDPYPEPSSWRKYLTGKGGRRTRKSRKSRKSKRSRKSRRR